MSIVRRTTLGSGVPLYFDKLPKGITPVCLSLCVWAGSCDDIAVGHKGIHHWGEHVPFRGTEHFPLSSDISGPFERFGGQINAYTGHDRTVFWAYVPRTMWRKALELIIDLVALPLFRDEDIDAERLIIKEEMKQGSSELHQYVWERSNALLFGSHPYAHPILGDEASLEDADADAIRKMHVMSYARNRCSLFVSGNLPFEQVAKHAEKLTERIPARAISARPYSAAYGPFPAWREGHFDEEDTSFEVSAVLMLFPAPALKASLAHRPVTNVVTSMFTCGGIASPLYRIVREERQLVYNTNALWSTNADGGVWGFAAECGSGNIRKVLAAFRDVLRDPEVRSRERFAYVRDAYWGEQQMRLVNPSDRTSSMMSSLCGYGEVLNEHEMMERVLDVRLEEVLEQIDAFDPKTAHTIVLKGRA